MQAAAKQLSANEARFLVDSYYTIQDDRIRTGNQISALSKSDDPHELLDWLNSQARNLEGFIKIALDLYSEDCWGRSVKGIGPVLAAGLLAHIDIEKAPTVGHIWRYAGLDPTSKWKKGKKRPWNANLKTLCWKIGESFVKFQDSQYGQAYVDRKKLEIERNEAGKFADQAEAILKAKKIGKDTDAYKAYIEGRLPKAHIHARAKRYAVKLFLSHWHEMEYKKHYGKPPPLPYPIAHQDHVHLIAPQAA
jgi:hypothetical protein